MFHCAKSLVVGPEECVGLRYFPATSKHPPLRIFYPANSGGNSDNRHRSVGWFSENGLGFCLAGYVHIAVARSHSRWFRWCLFPLVHLVSLFLPMGWMKLPGGVFLDAPFAFSNSNMKRPVVIFSHGLTGTGEENAVLYSAWAKRGFVVVSIHHTDGSSCRVLRENNESLYYKHGPSFEQYDANFRPNQIQQRAQEMMQAYQFLQSELLCPARIRQGIDMERVIASGFSYGAATAALVAVSNPKKFCGCILLDSWLYIDVSESAGIEFEFPKQVFDNGGLKDIPCLLVNSEQFEGYPKLWEATKKLAAANSQNKLHVIKGAGHQNFADAVFWVPIFLLKRLRPVVGPVNPVDAYREILNATIPFMEQVVTCRAHGRSN